MSAQSVYSQSRDIPSFHDGILAGYASATTTDKQRRSMIEHSSVAGVYYMSHLRELSILFAPGINSEQNTILGSTSDSHPIPVLAGPESFYYAAGIAPKSAFPELHLSKEAIDASMLKDTIFEHEKDLVVFLLPVICPFQFGQQTLESANITESAAREALVQSHGEYMKTWVTPLSVIVDKQGDITKVLKNFSNEWWQEQFPALNDESITVLTQGQYPSITVVHLPPSYKDEHLHMKSMFSQVTEDSKPTSNHGVVSSAPQPQVIYTTTQDASMASKLKLGQDYMQGLFMSGGINLVDEKVISLEVPEANDATKHCLSQDGGLEVAANLIKSALDTGQVLEPDPKDNKNIMMIYRVQSDHDKVLIKNLLAGNYQKTPLTAASAGASSTHVGIMCWGKETTDQLTNRRQQDSQCNAEDLAGDSASNKSKKRTLMSLANNIRSQKQVYEIMASFIQDASVLFNQKNKPSLIYVIYNDLFDFLVESDTLVWLDKHRRDMPAIWCWIASILDKVWAGFATAATDIRVVVPIQSGSFDKLNEEKVVALYQKVVKLYFNLKNRLQEAIDNDEPFTRFPDWAPDSVKPGYQPKNKKQNVGASSSQSQSETGNTNQGSMSGQLRFSGGNKSFAKGGKFASKSGGGSSTAAQARVNTADAEEKKAQGTFIAAGRFNFILDRSLMSRYCKFHHQKGFYCYYEGCHRSHDDFKSWQQADKDAQIAHVRANKERLGFNKDQVSVDDIGADNADLLVDGNGNAGES